MKLSELSYVNKVFWGIIKYFNNWPEFYWKHFLKIDKKMIVKMPNGYKLKILPYNAEASIIMEIWAFQSYTPKGFEIGKKDTVIDIGGHIGIFSLYASSFATKGRIFAFEPLPENYNAFKNNIMLNNVKNIYLEKKAVASKTGTRSFYAFNEKNSGTSSLYKSDNTKKITVKTTKFSEIVSKNNIKTIDFLKVDCEGGEYDILFTMPNNILHNIKKISMEYHDNIPGHNHKEIVSFLKKNGFKVHTKGTMLYAKR